MHACSVITFKKTVNYRIVGTFKRENFREWVENKIFAEKTFTDCSLVSPPKDATLPILQRKLSRIATKP